MTDPEFLTAVSRSVDLRLAGDLSGAAELADYVCAARPEEPSAWHTAAMVASDLGLYRDALYCRQRAVELLDVLATHTRLPDAHQQYIQQCVYGYATSLLLHGEWQRAWPFWEISRLGSSWMPVQGSNFWQGETDGDLLVICEGGYGDLFQFMRFIPLLRARVLARRIGIIVFKGLKTFRNWKAIGADEVYEIGDEIPLGVWRYSTAFLSLPAMLGINWNADVPRDKLGACYEYASQGPVGFCWRSEEYAIKRRVRSLTWQDAEEITGFLIDEAIPVHSLCPQGKDLAAGEFCHRTPNNLVCYSSRMETWGDTARYIAGMSMVVTVDTAVAHLAGLLGCPTLLLLPLNSDWRWGLVSEQTPWYPSVRLFRNQHPLKWERERIVDTALTMYRDVSGLDKEQDEESARDDWDASHGDERCPTQE